MAQPESRIVNRAMGIVREQPDAWVRKVHGSKFGNAGEPDLDACVGGIALKVEVKAPGNKPTPLQWAALRRWARAGAVAAWINDAEQIRPLIARCHAMWPSHASEPHRQPVLGPEDLS